MEIGLFQLENLLHSNARFLFFDLRKGSEQQAPAPLVRLLSKSIKTAATEVVEYLQKEKAAKESPIVLMCEDGKASSVEAKRLEDLGYLNIYVVERGMDGLISEL